MPTLDQIDLVIREYHIVNILLFIMGWMTYDLIKLRKSNKPSAEQLDMVKANIQKAKQLHEKRKSNYSFISEKDELQSKYYTIIDDYDKKHKSLQDKNTTLSAKMNIARKKISALEFENKFLKTKVDNLVEELMKRQSYDNIKPFTVEKPSKFFQESSYPFATFTNQNNERANS